jgi:hypothetical protein
MIMFSEREEIGKETAADFLNVLSAIRVTDLKKKTTNTMQIVCGQTAEFLNITPSGTYNYHSSSKC